jgi:tryptophanyl-tRNA synthetase
VEFVTPFRERTFALLEDRETLDGILARGADRARAVASEKLRLVHDRLGFVPAKR